jgi:NAD(P)-dependent dehydrogenase (short-subunit alcohol dehydrogenase family)
MDINKETVVLITGAGSGLGMATALRLAASGAKIVAIDINESGLAALEGQLSAEQFMGIRASVADSEEVSSAIDMAVSRYGALHVAVNCAGVADAAKTVSKGKPHPLDIWNKVISINLTGTFNVIRLAAAAMANNTPNADGERGVIINTSSGAAFQGQVGQAAYAASKAAIVGLTLPVARDLADQGIRVCSIAPGLFETGMVSGLPVQVTQSIIDRMVLFPMRMGQPDEYANLAEMIVRNAYFNATTISLDAGARLTPR